jgi:uncharacterized protein DUF397
MTEWRKSSRSTSQADSNCVEVADLAGNIGVRDSKNPGGPRRPSEQPPGARSPAGSRPANTIWSEAPRTDDTNGRVGHGRARGRRVGIHGRAAMDLVRVRIAQQ